MDRRCSSGSIDDREPPRRISWINAAWIVNAAVIGAGVLTIPESFATLGWLLGGLSLVLCLLGNVYCAYIMLEVRNIYPKAITMPDAAELVYGRNTKHGMRVVLYLERVLANCSFVTLLAHTLGSAFNNVHWCEPIWCLIVLIFLMMFSWVKTFDDTGPFNIINIGTITVAVVLVCGWALSNGTLAETSVIPHPGTTFTQLFAALSQIVFAFSGNWMYFEIMSEMERPRDFMKSFCVAGPIQLLLYAIIGAFGYALLGGQKVPGSIIDAVSFGPLMTLVTSFVVVHIFCGIITNTVALTRFFHHRISPKTVNESSSAAQFVRSGVFFMIISLACLISMMVPSFSSIVRLVGALFEAPISFVFPFLLYVGTWRQNPEKLQQRHPWLTLGVGAFIAMIGVTVMVLGTTGVLHELGNQPHNSCNCMGMWNTCECSSSRMPEGMCPAGSDWTRTGTGPLGTDF